jgi:DNA polymerase elongation subunit (family B)
MISYDAYGMDIADSEERMKAIFVHAGKLAEDLSAFFGPPIELEFEKLFCGFFLISKKRYFGLKREDLDGPLKMDSKGVASVRRSSPAIHRGMYQRLQELFLSSEGDMTPLYDYLRSELQRMVDGKASVAEYSRTCQLKSVYATPQCQSTVRDKIARRAPGSEPRAGDRVAFALMRPPPGKTLAAYDMAEDPDYMVEHGIPIAAHYYINSFRTSIEQLFEISGCNMKRVQLLFDQAEDIAMRQQQGITTLQENSSIIREYTDEEILKAPSSRQMASKQRSESITKSRAKRKRDEASDQRSAALMLSFFKPKQGKSKGALSFFTKDKPK